MTGHLARNGLALAVAGAAASAVVLAAGSGPVGAAPVAGSPIGVSPAGSGVTVNGIGAAAGAPDVMRVHFAISKRAPDVSAAIEGYSVTYDISDRTKLLASARDGAFADAKRKAEAYARLAGRTLGAVRTVQEGNPGYYYEGNAEFSGLSGGLSAPSAVPLSPGTRNVTVAVTVVWDLI